jgi:hypothetical protein
MHMAIAHVFETLSCLAGRQSCPEQVYHMNKTITMLNRRIANSHITNATIFAVSSLISFEVCTLLPLCIVSYNTNIHIIS